MAGAACLFILNEMRGYNEAYRALAEVEQRQAEARDLRAQKAQLNTEILALLGLKEHFAAQSAALEMQIAE